MVNRQVVLRSRPKGIWPTVDNFELVTVPVPAPADGQFVVRNVWLSIDPAMRGWVKDMRNYSEPVPIGGVMRGFTVGEVAESRHPDYKAGDFVTGAFGWQDYAVGQPNAVVRRIDPGIAPISTALGVLGHTGMTAYVGLLDIGRPRAGETVVVSTAAGAVGSVAGQVAKIEGCRTVGLTGAEAKVRLCLDEFSYDACLNYRAAPDLSETLGEACPNGVDVYFDNTGGIVLDAVLDHLNRGARIVVCGTTGDDVSPMGPRLNRRLIVARARMQGFLILDHFDRFAEGIAQMAEWLRAGRLRYREEIVEGLERAPDALIALERGDNLGKLLVRVVRER